MNPIRNRKALEAGVSWLVDILLLISILTTGYFALQDMNAGEVVAESNAMGLAAAIDIAEITPENVRILNVCPTEKKFVVDSRSVNTSAESVTGTGTASSYFMQTQNGVGATIDCTGYKYLAVSKNKYAATAISLERTND